MQVSSVVEEALFRDVNHALNFAYSMLYASAYPSSDLVKRFRFNAWTDLSQLDRHAQAAYLRDIVDRILTAPERAAIIARHGHGEEKLKAIQGLSKHVEGVVKNSGECLVMVVSSVYLDVCGIRRIAAAFDVTVPSIRDDLLSIKGHIHALEKIAYSSLEAEFIKYHGLIDL